MPKHRSRFSLMRLPPERFKLNVLREVRAEPTPAQLPRPAPAQLPGQAPWKMADLLDIEQVRAEVLRQQSSEARRSYDPFAKL